MNTPWSFRDVVQVIEEETIGRRSSIGKISPSRIRLFATDLALIGFSVRTGYLVDAFALQHPCKVFSSLLDGLRNRVPLFRGVVHLYEPCSEQSIFVTVPLLLERCPGSFSETDQGLIHLGRDEISQAARVLTGDLLETAFVGALQSDAPEMLPLPPDKLIVLLQQVVAQLTVAELPTTISLPYGLSPDTTVPLAAFLLEYPVAYCPSSDATEGAAFLSRVTLNVYDCILELKNDDNIKRPNLSKGQHHSFLKFSCPSVLETSQPQLAPALLMARVRSRFEGRLRNITTNSTSPIIPTMTIHHTTQTLDRVAL